MARIRAKFLGECQWWPPSAFLYLRPHHLQATGVCLCLRSSWMYCTGCPRPNSLTPVHLTTFACTSTMGRAFTNSSAFVPCVISDFCKHTINKAFKLLPGICCGSNPHRRSGTLSWRRTWQAACRACTELVRMNAAGIWLTASQFLTTFCF